jgi:hypothetical protein
VEISASLSAVPGETLETDAGFIQDENGTSILLPGRVVAEVIDPP